MATLLDKRCNCFANIAPAEPICAGDAANGPCPFFSDCKKATEISMKLFGSSATGARDYSDMTEAERQKVEDLLAAKPQTRSRPAAEPKAQEQQAQPKAMEPASDSSALDALERDLEREIGGKGQVEESPVAAAEPKARRGRKPKAVVAAPVEEEPTALATQVKEPEQPVAKPDEPATSDIQTKECMEVSFHRAADDNDALSRIADALGRIADALSCKKGVKAEKDEPAEKKSKRGRPSGKRGRPKSK